MSCGTRHCLPPDAQAFVYHTHLGIVDCRQDGDTADVLAYSGDTAVFLNGSTVRRAATTPTQDANVTLTEATSETSGVPSTYILGEGGSPIVVDGSDAPIVQNVTSTAYAGEYGAGQRIYFQVTAALFLYLFSCLHR